MHINEEFSRIAGDRPVPHQRLQAVCAGRLGSTIGLRPSITITVRMDEANTSIRDYYLLPWLEAGRTPSLRLAPENGILLDAYRFDTLDAFVELTKRVPLRVAA